MQPRTLFCTNIHNRKYLMQQQQALGHVKFHPESANSPAYQSVLQCRFIGLQQGDPDLTFDKLPQGAGTPHIEPGLQLLDLRTTTHQQLMELSAASADDPFGELLPFTPGVLPSRLGYMTGMRTCWHALTCAATCTCVK